jgi:peptidoglycan/LPS O-acetylase OafA/YrhL
MQTQFDQRENNFDFIRLLLSVLVIFSHSYPLGTGYEIAEPFNRLTHNQVTGGDIAVDLFFVISGFLITASYERTANVASYLKKRILRIYPAFVAVMLIDLVIVLPASGGHLLPQPHIRQVLEFVVQTFRLREFHYIGAFPGTPHPGQVNGSIWSIQYEFWCYLGVIVLGVLGALRSRKVLLAGFSCTVILSYLFVLFRWDPELKLPTEVFGFLYSWVRLLPMYAAGIVFYRLRTHLSLSPGWIAAACAALALAAIEPFGWTLLFPIAGAYLVLALAFHPRIRLHGWARFGDFSYGTYLYAFPVQQLVMRLIGHPIPPWELFALATPPTLICAVASWYLVERRFLLKVRHTAPTARLSDPEVLTSSSEAGGEL